MTLWLHNQIPITLKDAGLNRRAFIMEVDQSNGIVSDGSTVIKRKEAITKAQ